MIYIYLSSSKFDTGIERLLIIWIDRQRQGWDEGIRHHRPCRKGGCWALARKTPLNFKTSRKQKLTFIFSSVLPPTPVSSCKKRKNSKKGKYVMGTIPAGLMGCIWNLNQIFFYSKNGKRRLLDLTFFLLSQRSRSCFSFFWTCPPRTLDDLFLNLFFSFFIMKTRIHLKQLFLVLVFESICLGRQTK